MDMSLPGIDGWTATRQLKADAATSGIPIIALTAHAAGDRGRCRAAESGPPREPGLGRRTTRARV
jgi:CheY-like chemotaxis protein